MNIPLFIAIPPITSANKYCCRKFIATTNTLDDSCQRKSLTRSQSSLSSSNLLFPPAIPCRDKGTEDKAYPMIPGKTMLMSAAGNLNPALPPRFPHRKQSKGATTATCMGVPSCVKMIIHQHCTEVQTYPVIPGKTTVMPDEVNSRSGLAPHFPLRKQSKDTTTVTRRHNGVSPCNYI